MLTLLLASPAALCAFPSSHSSLPTDSSEAPRRPLFADAPKHPNARDANRTYSTDPHSKEKINEPPVVVPGVRLNTTPDNGTAGWSGERIPSSQPRQPAYLTRPGEQRAAQDKIAKALPHSAVAYIQCTNGSSGSGVLVSKNKDYGLVVTNFHVIRDDRTGKPVGEARSGIIHVTLPGENASTARVIRVDKIWDLALLAIHPPRAKPVTIAPRAADQGKLTLRSDGESIWIAGYGGDEKAYQVARGICYQYHPPDEAQKYPPNCISLIGVQARNGDSGGAMFNQKGELAGVVSHAGSDAFTVGIFSGQVKAFVDGAAAQLVKLPPQKKPQRFATRGDLPRGSLTPEEDPRSIPKVTPKSPPKKKTPKKNPRRNALPEITPSTKVIGQPSTPSAVAPVAPPVAPPIAAPVEPPAAPVEPPAAPVEPPAAPVEPPAAPVKPPAAPVEPPAASTEPPAASVEPPASPAEPPAASVEPPVASEKKAEEQNSLPPIVAPSQEEPSTPPTSSPAALPDLPPPVPAVANDLTPPGDLLTETPPAVEEAPRVAALPKSPALSKSIPQPEKVPVAASPAAVPTGDVSNLEKFGVLKTILAAFGALAVIFHLSRFLYAMAVPKPG